MLFLVGLLDFPCSIWSWEDNWGLLNCRAGSHHTHFRHFVLRELQSWSAHTLHSRAASEWGWMIGMATTVQAMALGSLNISCYLHTEDILMYVFISNFLELWSGTSDSWTFPSGCLTHLSNPVYLKLNPTAFFFPNKFPLFTYQILLTMPPLPPSPSPQTLCRFWFLFTVSEHNQAPTPRPSVLSIPAPSSALALLAHIRATATASWLVSASPPPSSS